MCMQSRLRKTLFTRLQESRSATNASCLQHSKVTSAGESKGRRGAKVRVCARHIKVQRGPKVAGPLKCSNQSVKAQPKRAKSGHQSDIPKRGLLSIWKSCRGTASLLPISFAVQLSRWQSLWGHHCPLRPKVAARTSRRKSRRKRFRSHPAKAASSGETIGEEPKCKEAHNHPEHKVSKVVLRQLRPRYSSSSKVRWGQKWTPWHGDRPWTKVLWASCPWPAKAEVKVRACHTLQQKSQKFNLTVCEGRLLRKVLLLFGHRAKVSCDDAEKLPVQQKSDRPWRTGRASERQGQSENGCGGKAQS